MINADRDVEIKNWMLMVTTFLSNTLHTAVTKTTGQRFDSCDSHANCVTGALILTVTLMRTV